MELFILATTFFHALQVGDTLVVAFCVGWFMNMLRRGKLLF